MRRFNQILHSSRAAIDLASIMVGVIIIGLIGSVIAATVFAVIPWSQDRAAKQQLDNITSAENAYRGLSADNPSRLVAVDGSEVKNNSFADSAGLAKNSLLATSDIYCVVVDTNAQDYTAYAKSASGRIYKSTSAKKPALAVDGETTCLGTASNPDAGSTVPVQPVNLDRTTFTFNCPTTVSAQVPIQGVKGTLTWSDGEVKTYPTVTTTIASKTLTANTEYKVTLVGTFNTLSASSTSTAARPCLRSMDEWGSQSGTKTATSGFARLVNLTSVPENIPATVTDVSQLFLGDSLMNDSNVSKWDVSNISNFTNMFAQSGFNQAVDQWNMSKADSVAGMFSTTPFNQPLNSWDMQNVTDTSNMFQNAKSFNQPLNNWNFTKLKTMQSMFSGASSFNQNINSWNVSTAWNGIGVFRDATSFNQPLDKWDVSTMTTVYTMFYGASSFNQNITGWKLTNATDWGYFLYNATSFSQDLSKWNVSKVNNSSGHTNFATGSAMPAEYLPKFTA